MSENTLHRWLGPLLMALACAGFAMIDMLAKYLGKGYPVTEVLFLRYAVQSVAVCILFLPRLKGRILRTANLHMQLLRGCFLLGASVCVINGLKYLPLAESTAVHFLSPIFIAVLASLFLGEKARWIDWLAVVLGFVGVVIIVRPGGELLTWAILFPVCSALCNAMYQVVTRYFRSSEHPATTNLYAALVGLVATLPFMPSVWITPDLKFAGLVVVAGVVGATSHLLVTKALECTPAASLGPYSYTQLAWAAVFGYLVFDAIPDFLTWLGIAVIASSGLLISLHHLFTKPRSTE